jgi:hypothetical protein
MAEEKRDVKFETIKMEEIKFGKKNFLEVAKKKATSAEGTNEFISIARGFYGSQGKSYKNTVSLPVDNTLLDAMIEAVKKCR